MWKGNSWISIIWQLTIPSKYQARYNTIPCFFGHEWEKGQILEYMLIKSTKLDAVGNLLRGIISRMQQPLPLIMVDNCCQCTLWWSIWSQARPVDLSLTHHGCDKSGIAADWDTYLVGIGETNKIITFRGNRFNVLFYDAAAVYYHRHHIYEFLSALPDPNNLLKAVNFDIQQLYIAHVRALGIVDTIITGLLWGVIKSHDGIQG